MAGMDDVLLPSWQSPIIGEAIYRHNNVRSADGNNVILMQFTGAKTSGTQREVYEGDVLCQGNDNHFWVVLWSDMDCAWHAKDEYGSLPLWEVLSGQGVKIAGNIYENPELLESKEETDGG